MSADCGLRGLDLLDAVIAHIEAHPETWDQEEYRCGTGMCVAGLACELAGGEWIAGPDDALCGFLVALPGEDDVTGDEVHAHHRAGHLLGLTRREAAALFDANNRLDEIRALRDHLQAVLS